MKRIIVLGVILITLLYLSGFVYINYKNKGDVAILAYHHFMSEEEKEEFASDNYNVISTEKFEEQLEYLKENNYHSITPQQLECYMKNDCKIPKKSVLITIDDGNISTYYKALPLLEKYNYSSLVFVISSRMNNTTEDWNADHLAFLGKDKIMDIKQNHQSMTIGSHSHDLHKLINEKNPIFTKTEEEIYTDVEKSKELLEAEYYAYPYGVCDEKYINALSKANYKMAFTFKDNKMASKKDNILAIPRIEIRGDYSMNQFKEALNSKITLVQYSKKIIKKIIRKN